jgi:hypothetical protein
MLLRTVFARHAFASCASKLALAVGTVDKSRDKPDNKRPEHIRNMLGALDRATTETE